MARKKKDAFILEAEEKFVRLENYLTGHKKQVSTVTTILVIAIAAIAIFKFWYLPGQEKEAENAIYPAQRYFALDSINQAINGDGSSLGFLDIADQYSWTPAGHLANYYLGLCYYDKRDYQKAIDYLGKFDAGDALISPNAEGVMGDAEMQLNQPDKALEDYLEAVKRSSNDFTAPLYLKKAGLVCEMKGNYSQAVTLYERIKTEYHDSQEAQDITKYIYRAKNKGGLM